MSPSSGVRSRGRLLLAALVALVVVVAIVVVLAAAGGGETPPATGAATVVPADALLYVHLSIDPRRPAVKRALALARRFPDYPLLEAAITARLGTLPARTGSLDFARDVRPWLGREAALALLNTSTSTAGALLVADVADRARARRVLAAAAAPALGSYHGTQILTFPSGAEVAFVGHYLALGQDASVRAAIDVASGHVPSLAADPVYRRAIAGEPAGRVLDGYASVDGVRRVLAPQGGLVGAAGALLDQSALAGVSVSLTPEAPGARARVHSVLDPRLVHAAGPRLQAFSPSLVSAVPPGAMLLLDITGLDQVAPRLLGAGAAGGVGGGVSPLLRRLGAALQAEGIDVQRDVLSIVRGETVVAVTPHSRRPALIIVAHTPDEARAKTALAALEVPLAQLFAPAGNGPGQAPVFNDRTVDGITAHQLSLAPGLEIDYAVFDRKVVVSTNLDGIAAVHRHGRSLADDPGYHATLDGRPGRVTSLLFIDFTQLLSLGEQTGLTRSARYRELRADLQKVRAIGLDSTSGEADSTAELFLQIS